ncbi:glycosyltransferase family 4 protein [Vibrio campbellii]|nr:glycosyltransferase family 4 protein [Vibrio campbellii]
MTKKLAYVTNIPTPYRDFRFRILADCLFEYGIELVVLYMAHSEPGRYWDSSKLRYGYKSKVYKNFGFNVGKKRFFHFNPGLIFDLYTKRYDYVVIGGVASPSHILSALFAKSKNKIMSVESNIHNIRPNYLRDKIKSFTLNRFDRFQVTGDPCLEYINYYRDTKVVKSDLLYLRNIINEDDFNVDDFNVEQGNEEIERQIKILCIARLEEQKGLIEFFEAINGIEGDYEIALLGSGSLESKIRKIVNDYNINVKILGQKDSNEIGTWMNKSDVFLLPSKRDPSPLSCIEAIFNGKPLLLSRNIGNMKDVLDEGVNGFSFDINDKDSIRFALNEFLKLERNDIHLMGEESKKIYHSKFSPKILIEDYVKKIIEV